eukprot:CAMPEP_0197177548 /NCGR_PEP_ID=MMETSP1423-20130617/3112_1 /TAXON_ID=476441 /ORGANISM="Pseudo-nitzschia heimii, Strain UNC1101" /LENGTH=282 /DNA_ID=CAMNT_0042627107 /DNA_START=53 /DNA_END=901 /DNA_ORIENTATION=-
MERSSFAMKTVFAFPIVLAALALLSSSGTCDAFAVRPTTTVSTMKADATTTTTTRLNALYERWVPRTTAFEDALRNESKRAAREITAEDADDAPTATTTTTTTAARDPAAVASISSRGPAFWAATAAALVVALAALPQVSLAVSGGGLDYAGLDISNQDFSKGNYKGKDFTQVLARNTNFAGSNLAGCRFPKAYLINANYEGADIRGVSFEGTNLESANLKNAVASGAYFGATVIDAGSVENADFTDAQFPPKTLALMCDRPDMKGTNPTTGVDTRESAMCP